MGEEAMRGGEGSRCGSQSLHTGFERFH